jgi:hypothetical protein
VPLAFAVCLTAAGACAQPPPPIEYPAAVSGASTTMVVRGQYEPVALDRVDRVSLESSRLVLHGSLGQAAVALPASVDTTQPTRHWALVTESSAGDTRSLTFTHAESLDDFTLVLPDSPAQFRYGVFADRNGGEVMLFAWGEGERCFWGHVTITRAGSGGR